MWNNVLSTPKKNKICLDIERFYLNTTMDRYEYMNVPMLLTPQSFMEEYALHEYIYKDHIYFEIRKGMYGITQAGRIWKNFKNNFLHPLVSLNAHLRQFSVSIPQYLSH